MSARRNYAVGAAVAALAAAILFSNRKPEMPNGNGLAITSRAEYEAQREKMQQLSLPRVKAYEEGKPLTTDDLTRLREAGEILDRMTAFNPTRSGLFYLSGKIHHILGEDAIAEERFQQNVNVAGLDASHYPDESSAILETAAESGYQLSLLRMGHGDAKGAFEAANGAVKTIPLSSLYLTARASALNELRRVPEAKKDLEQALKLDPSNERARGLLKFISKG